MASQHYKQALAQAQRDLAYAIRQRDLWNLEIIRLQSMAKSLAIGAAQTEREEKASEEMNFQIGIAQAIEAIVNRSASHLSPVEIRDALKGCGYDLARYANPLALIHQTLVRLASDGRLQFVDGKYARSRWYDLYASGIRGNEPVRGPGTYLNVGKKRG